MFKIHNVSWASDSLKSTSLLPPNLEWLVIDGPKILFLGWLERLTYHRDELPRLEHVWILCNDRYDGDAYNEFAYEYNPHPSAIALKSVDIEFKVCVRKRDWEASWDGYDLNALALVAWQEPLAHPIRVHISVKPVNREMNGSGDDTGFIY